MSIKYNDRAGILARNRERLALLHRELTAPFSVKDAARALNTNVDGARRFLAYLVTHGWLARIRRNLYVTVPLDASTPSEWREDPWIVAAKTFDPCYIGGWSACEHWALTEQVFRDIVVITARPIRDRRPLIQGTRFHVKGASSSKLFGLETIWRGQVRLSVSDATKTVVDILDDPGIGGGMRQVADVLAEYLSGPHRSDALLLEYVRRSGNRAIYKRLGYSIEALGLLEPDLVTACLAEKSAGFNLLDPSLPARGPRLRRWGLRANTFVRRP